MTDDDPMLGGLTPEQAARAVMSEPCSTCQGLCCEDRARVYRASLRYHHTAHYIHVCPDCSDGLARRDTVDLKGCPLAPHDNQAVAEERAAVVAYLQACAEVAADGWAPIAGRNLLAAAHAIRRGEHRAEKPE
jgi:hypothetical protein